MDISTPGQTTPAAPPAPLVYLVDDVPALLELAAALLAHEGYRYQTFPSAEAAWAAFAAATPKPQLIMSDFSMGKMNGLQLLRQCKQSDPRVKTMLISGSVTEEVMQGMNLPVDAYLGKPYRVEDFVNAARALAPFPR